MPRKDEHGDDDLLPRAEAGIAEAAAQEEDGEEEELSEIMRYTGAGFVGGLRERREHRATAEQDA